MQASHLSGQMQYGLSPNPYTWTPKAHILLRETPTQAERDNKTVYSRNVISFSVGLMKSLQGNDKIFTSFRWNPRHTLDEIKSVQIQPCEAGFHRVSDFIHHKWISPVEDGFDCVFSVKDNTHIPSCFLITATQLNSFCHADYIMIIRKSIYFFSHLWYNSKKTNGGAYE